MNKKIFLPLMLLMLGAAQNSPHSNPRLTTVDRNTVSVVPEVVRPGGTAKVILRTPFLAQAHAAMLHYGFNGWNIRLTGAGAGSEETVGNINYFRRVPMTLNGATGAFELTIDVPQGARGLHFVVCRDGCGAHDWDNNGGQDYSWPIAFPFVGPLLTWNEAVAPDTGIVVTFFTSVDQPTWIKFGPAGTEPQELRDQGGERHSFVLHGLQPATEYTYQVGAGFNLTSETYSFKTAKPTASLSKVSFAVYSDAQDNGETGSFQHTVDELVQHQADLDFLIVAGDMPWNNHPGDWWTYFDKAKKLLASKVVMPAIGNHDVSVVNNKPVEVEFARWFEVPRWHRTASFYNFDYGPTRFFALDSEKMLDFSQPNSEQFTWLRDQLTRRQSEARASSAPLWTFTFWHIPPFNAGARHWQQQFDYRPTARLFPGVIDWDFCGHEHLGQRFRPLRPEADGSLRTTADYGDSEDSGVGFLILPAAGAVPEGSLIANAGSNGNIRNYVAYPAGGSATQIAPFNGFERVDIDGNEIRLRMFGASRDGADAGRGFYVRDEIRYRK